MKNVNGLAKSMALVESACEKGEITIIGEGARPTAIELYNKCVAFINKEYGVDILNLVAKAAMEKGKPCECNGTCHTVIVEVDEEEDEDEVLCVNANSVRVIVDIILGESMSCLSGSRHSNIVDEIVDYYKDMDGEYADDYNPDNIADSIYDILCDNLEIIDYDEDIIHEMIDEIVRKVYEDGITTN